MAQVCKLEQVCMMERDDILGQVYELEKDDILEQAYELEQDDILGLVCVREHDKRLLDVLELPHELVCDHV